MEILVKAIKRIPSRTTSDMSIDGEFFGHVVEDTVREHDTDNDGDIDAADVKRFKVNKETAIPAGRYQVIFEDSPAFGPDTLTLLDVPGFSFIRIHSGNDETHSEGCLIVGFRLTDAGTIVPGTTHPAVAALKKRVKAAFAANDDVWITLDREVA